MAEDMLPDEALISILDEIDSSDDDHDDDVRTPKDTIFVDIIDDIWIDIVILLHYQDFLHFQTTCQRFHRITKMTNVSINIGNDDVTHTDTSIQANFNIHHNFKKKLNQYWHDQSNLFCNNLPSNYNPKNWYPFYIQFRQFFIHFRIYNLQTQQIDYKLLKQVLSYDYGPLLRCCRLDTPLILDMMLCIEPDIININNIDDINNFNSKSTTSNQLSHCLKSRGQKLLTLLLLNCFRYNGINVTKYLFHRYSQDIVFNDCEFNGKKTTLLIESIKTGNDEIISWILNHPNCSKLITLGIQEKSNINPLHEICKSAEFVAKLKPSQRLSIKTIDLMIDKGVDINGQNWNGNTPLHSIVNIVARGSYIKFEMKRKHSQELVGNYFMTIIKHLVNLPSINTNIRNSCERTPLDEVLWWTRIEEDGIRSKTNINALDLVKILLTAKDVNIKDDSKSGTNVFHHATANGHYDVVECLCNHMIENAKKYSQLEINKLLNAPVRLSTWYWGGATPYILACRYLAVYWDIENVKHLNGMVKMIQLLVNIYHVDVTLTESEKKGSDMLRFVNVESKQRQFARFRHKLKQCERQYPKCVLTDTIIVNQDAIKPDTDNKLDCIIS